jgi:hypothetical protein
MLHYHYERLSEGYVEALRDASARGEVGEIDPEVTAWALMAIGELIGMRWILWGGRSELPAEILGELRRIVASVLEADA